MYICQKVDELLFGFFIFQTDINMTVLKKKNYKEKKPLNLCLKCDQDD